MTLDLFHLSFQVKKVRIEVKKVGAHVFYVNVQVKKVNTDVFLVNFYLKKVKRHVFYLNRGRADKESLTQITKHSRRGESCNLFILDRIYRIDR